MSQLPEHIQRAAEVATRIQARTGAEVRVYRQAGVWTCEARLAYVGRVVATGADAHAATLEAERLTARWPDNPTEGVCQVYAPALRPAIRGIPVRTVFRAQARREPITLPTERCAACGAQTVIVRDDEGVTRCYTCGRPPIPARGGRR